MTLARRPDLCKRRFTSFLHSQTLSLSPPSPVTCATRIEVPAPPEAPCVHYARPSGISSFRRLNQRVMAGATTASVRAKSLSSSWSGSGLIISSRLIRRRRPTALAPSAAPPGSRRTCPSWIGRQGIWPTMSSVGSRLGGPRQADRASEPHSDLWGNGKDVPRIELPQTFASLPLCQPHLRHPIR
jgi:hypothetical protein